MRARAVHLSPEDRRLIAQAVGAAETRTSGEIVCMLAQEVSDYRETPLVWAAAAALLLPFIAVFLGVDPTLPGGGWSAAAVPSGPSSAAVVGGYALVQAAVFFVAFLIAAVPPVRRFLTPGAIKAHRVHKAAVLQYVATGMAQAPGRTGVVIFASFRDRKVELVADEAIHQACGAEVWNAAVAAVQAGMRDGAPGEGFVRAVEICGAALAEHFPATGPRANAFSDEPVEL